MIENKNSFQERARRSRVVSDFKQAITFLTEQLVQSRAPWKLRIRGCAYRYLALLGQPEECVPNPQEQQELLQEEIARLNQSVQDIEEALRLNPRDLYAVMERASVRVQSGRIAEARVDIARALEINPSSMYHVDQVDGFHLVTDECSISLCRI